MFVLVTGGYLVGYNRNGGWTSNWTLRLIIHILGGIYGCYVTWLTETISKQTSLLWWYFMICLRFALLCNSTCLKMVQMRKGTCLIDRENCQITSQDRMKMTSKQELPTPVSTDVRPLFSDLLFLGVESIHGYLYGELVYDEGVKW